MKEPSIFPLQIQFLYYVLRKSMTNLLLFSAGLSVNLLFPIMQFYLYMGTRLCVCMCAFCAQLLSLIAPLEREIDREREK